VGLTVDGGWVANGCDPATSHQFNTCQAAWASCLKCCCPGVIGANTCGINNGGTAGP
jgi:hypothetical protein